MSSKAYLEAFNKGPCSPVLVVPSMITGRLVIDFVCKEAKKNYSDIWNTCGWYFNCSTKEVQIFPPGVKFSASFLPFWTDKYGACLTKLMAPDYTIDSKTGKATWYSKPGMDARPQWEGAYGIFGSTSSHKQSCSFRSNNYIMDVGGLQQLTAKYMADWFLDLEWLGYRADLSTFHFSYDW